MLVDNEENFEKAFSAMLDADILAVDTETFYIQPGVPTKLLGISVYGPIKGREELEIAFYFPFNHKHNLDLFGSRNLPSSYLRRLKTVFERESLETIFHNAKFDLKVLRSEGIEVNGKVWDTMLMSHMIDMNGPHSLDALAKKHLQADSQKKGREIKKLAKTLGDGKVGEGWHLIPPVAMADYAVQDTKVTYNLFRKFLPIIKQEGYLDEKVGDRTLWEREEEFCRLLLDMEQRGVLINERQAQQLADVCSQKREEIQSALGFDPMKPDRLAKKLFGPEPSGLGFPIQSLGKPSKSYPQGRPVMDKNVLLKFDHPVAHKVLEYRGLVKAESTWFRGFLEQTWPDGRVHPDFRQHGTVTTRLSCSGPNMQQLPREDEDDPEDGPMKHKVKTIIDVEPGWEVWEYDYSQLEPRLATCYSQQPELLEVWADGRDFYQEIADTLNITRYQAKQLMLAIMYGAGAAKTAEMLQVSQDESTNIVSEFWSQYPLLRRAVRAASEAARDRGYIRLWTGRRRHFKWSSEHHKAFNAAMQGGGAEIVKESGLRIKDSIPEIYIISQVHDSYWFEVPVDRLDLHDKIKQIMEWPSDVFHVPFPVEGKCLASA